MKRTIFILLAIAAVGCDKPDSDAEERNGVNTPADKSADNTGKNERDQDMNTLTPEDQGGDVDRTITQHVRQAVVKEYGATKDAANVKIVTADRVVTLRGPVESQEEKSTIGALAQGIERVTRVDNQLEVAGP